MLEGAPVGVVVVVEGVIVDEGPGEPSALRHCWRNVIHSGLVSKSLIISAASVCLAQRSS